MTVEPLDLSGADTTGFEPIPTGRYIVHIDNVTWKQTGPDGKMPEGTPMLNVDYVVDTDVHGDDKFAGRHIFTNYMNPDPSYENAAKIKGIFTNFLVVATGEDESKITSGKFKLDVEDLIGKQVKASVSIRPATDEYDAQNQVRGVKPLGEGAEAAGGLL